MPSSRRALLASLGVALTGAAGCLDASNGEAEPTDSPTATGTVTATRTPTTVPAEDVLSLGDTLDLGDVSVTVSDLVTAHSVRYLTAPDAMGVASTEHDQFVFVDVSVAGDGRPPAPHRFALVADGTVSLLVRDEHGVLRASLSTESAVVREWATDRFDRYWERAIPFDPTEFD